ncbi:retrovirus-related pol polyprotein from transposon TNT 1-94 [Tanacetum coccineum]
MYLKKAQSEKPCLYEIPYDISDPANRFVLDREETLTLEKKSISKLNKDLVKPYDYTNQNSLYENFKPASQEYHEQLAHANENDSFKFVHELKQEMHAGLKYVESLEKEIDELESDKAEFSNMYDILLQECVSNEVIFAKLEKHSISLELALQQCQERMKNDIVCKEKASNVFLKEHEQYFEIQELKAQLQDKNIAISELKKLIMKCKGESVETKFDKPSVIRQPNAQRIPKPSVLGKPTLFSDSLERKVFSKTKSVPKTNVSEGLSKPVTTQILPQTTRQVIRNTNVITPGMYRIDTRTTQTRAPQLSQTSRNTDPRVFTSTVVIHRTNVSRPQFRSTQMKDKVVPNNSQVKFKKTEVEDHHRISTISNKTKSVTACNDSLKSRTSNVNAIVQLILFIVDSGCTKYMTDNLKLLCNFVAKYIGIVRFGNDQFALILGYGDLVQENIMINRVYYVEGLNHNLFSGNDLLTSNRGYDIYTISLQETTSLTSICFMAKASPTQAWLWHRRLSHLNFDYINLLSKKDVVIGLPKLKYVKDQLCSSCEMSKEKRSSFKTKAVPSSKGRLNFLHMDLCGPMRVASINGKKYILMIQQNLQAQVISAQTNRGTKFLNKTLHAYFKEEGIEHQTSTPRTPEQNDVVERQNRTLVEAARTMLSSSKLPLYQVYQGRLLASFQDDAKYEHVGLDKRSHDGKDDKDIQGKDLKISKSKTKSKDNDKGLRSKITQHEGTSLQHNKDQRFKNSMTKQSQQVQGSKIQDITSGIRRPHIKGDC